VTDNNGVGWPSYALDELVGVNDLAESLLSWLQDKVPACPSRPVVGLAHVESEAHLVSSLGADPEKTLDQFFIIYGHGFVPEIALVPFL
jgi:hypothetical protein